VRALPIYATRGQAVPPLFCPRRGFEPLSRTSWNCPESNRVDNACKARPLPQLLSPMYLVSVTGVEPGIHGPGITAIPQNCPSFSQSLGLRRSCHEVVLPHTRGAGPPQ
jgi:hypothetical protein